LTFIGSCRQTSRYGGGTEINVAIVTIDEPFYTPTVIGTLIRNSPPDIKYVCIILVPSRPKKMSEMSFILNQIKVFGLSQFTKVASLYVIRKFVSIISSKEYSVPKVARTNSVKLMKTNSLKSENILRELKMLSLDVIISVGSSRIFGKSILSIPRLGCLNVHAGMLPRNRGINPSFWVLLNQEKISAVTVHYVNEEIDDGEIIQQDVFEIQGITRLHDIYLKVVEIAPKTIIKSLIAIRDESVRTTKNERSISTYHSFPTKQDGQKFRRLGLRYM
jgi:methionyl-tRNA formyltransferase